VNDLDQPTLISLGFHGFRAWEDLRSNGIHEIPQDSGLYTVVRTSRSQPVFLERSPPGWFKGKDPTVPVTSLESKWIDGAEVVYIGEGGNLRNRLKLFLRFGCGDACAHKGGRYIWQLADAFDLLVAWKPCGVEVSSRNAERELLERFYAVHGQLPFANLRW
jgi:hypothetical protein